VSGALYGGAAAPRLRERVGDVKITAMGARVGREAGPVEGSTLALDTLELARGERASIPASSDDVLLYVASGAGGFELAGVQHVLDPGSAALVPAGSEASVKAGPDGLGLVRALVGPDAERHAPLGPPETVVRSDSLEAAGATGARSFEILFGPHNGSTRATLFLGHIPPGRAPWHYHLYDEIVWVPAGPGRLHLGETVEELGPGATFRLHPRELHVVENASPDLELTVLGLFTPAGSPSAAYLTADTAAAYAFASAGRGSGLPRSTWVERGRPDP
jgi:quercetin dioxygenase-like cupin family protein